MDDKNKKKVIFIASLAAVFIVGILFIQLLNSDEEEQKSDEISTPESERDAYNSRTEAFNDNGKVIDLVLIIKTHQIILLPNHQKSLKRKTLICSRTLKNKLLI